eukprot:c10698_g1_i2.p1 GENE.c10698_g1_i2~~c10698_g1_i2.p1  ORF type:complete len:262 (+),score=71.24 c10698_g1_i2:376-1161(+)
MIVPKLELSKTGTVQGSVLASSASTSPTTVIWMNRPPAQYPEEPVIGTSDYSTAVSNGDVVYAENMYGGAMSSKILTAGNGANVFVRKAQPLNLGPVLGGGWLLVRHVIAGGEWFAASDHLKGTSTYGKFVNSPQASSSFSIPFSSIEFDEFLFATGDMQSWVIVSKKDVLTTKLGSSPVTLIQSSVSSKPTIVTWYNRPNNAQDPTVGTTNVQLAIATGDIVYMGGGAPDSKVLANHAGANVFIRKSAREIPSMCTVWMR